MFPADLERVIVSVVLGSFLLGFGAGMFFSFGMVLAEELVSLLRARLGGDRRQMEEVDRVK